MTKLEQLLYAYRNATIAVYLNGEHKAFLEASEALKQHIEGAMEAAVVHGKETERESAKLDSLACQEARADAWDDLIEEWVE